MCVCVCVYLCVKRRRASINLNPPTHSLTSEFSAGLHTGPLQESRKKRSESPSHSAFSPTQSAAS